MFTKRTCYIKSHIIPREYKSRRYPCKICLVLDTICNSELDTDKIQEVITPVKMFFSFELAVTSCLFAISTSISSLGSRVP